MSQKSSLPQAAKAVSYVLMSDRHRYSLFNLYPDDSEKTPEDALKLKLILNRRLAKEEQARRRLAEAGDERMRRRLAEEGEGRIDPFRRVEFKDSRESACLQVADILTGAIAYELNGHSKKPEAADYRVALAHGIVRDRKRFGVVGNIIDGTLDWGRCTIRPLRRRHFAQCTDMPKISRTQGPM